MSMGSDYAQGYSLGQRDIALQQSKRPYDSVYGGRRAMPTESTFGNYPSGGTRRGNLPSPSEIRSLAIEDALNKKKQQLQLDAVSLENEKAKLSNEAMQFNNSRMRSNELGTQATAAQTRADTLRSQNNQTDAGTRNNMINQAVQSVYMGDSNGFKQFFDVYGAPGVTVNGMKKNGDGTIDVYFNGSESQKFKNADELIKQLLMPAAAIASGYTSKAKLNPETNQKNRKWAVEQLLKAGNDAPTEEQIKAKMSLITGEQSQGIQLGNATENNSNKVTGNINQGVTHNYISRKNSKTGEEKRTAIIDGKVIDLVKDPRSGNWYPPSEMPQKSEAMPVKKKAEKFDITKYRTASEKKAALKKYLMDQGSDEKQANKYIQDAIKAGKL